MFKNAGHKKIVRPKGPKQVGHSKKKGIIVKLRGRSIFNIFLKVLGIITSSRSSLGCLGGLIRFNLLVHSFKIQVFQVHSWTMFHHIPPKQLEPFELLAKQYGIVFINCLESTNSLGLGVLHFLASHG